MLLVLVCKTFFCRNKIALQIKLVFQVLFVFLVERFILIQFKLLRFKKSRKRSKNISMKRPYKTEKIRDAKSIMFSLYMLFKATQIMQNGCQFHQHFMYNFFADILAPKNFKPKTQLCNFWNKISYKKCASKTLMKLMSGETIK